MSKEHQSYLNSQHGLDSMIDVFSFVGLKPNFLRQPLHQGKRFQGTKLIFLFGTCMLRKNLDTMKWDIEDSLHEFACLHSGANIHLCQQQMHKANAMAHQANHLD